jgi:hypothetical protein
VIRLPLASPRLGAVAPASAPSPGLVLGCSSMTAALAAVVAVPTARPLDQSCDDQPVETAGSDEHEHADHEADQRRRQHRPAPDAIGQRAEGKQRGHHADPINRENDRQLDRREVPFRLVDGVEGRRRAGGEQQHAEDHGHQPKRAGLRQLPMCRRQQMCGRADIGHPSLSLMTMRLRLKLLQLRQPADPAIDAPHPLM